MSSMADWTSLQLDLSSPNFAFINPSTNRVIFVQGSSPFPGRVVVYTDSTGSGTISNLPASGQFQCTVQAPPFQSIFYVYVASTNMGLIQASTNIVSQPGSTFPSGQSSWSVVVSDERYSRNTNTIFNITSGSTGLTIGGGARSVFNPVTITITNLPSNLISNLDAILANIEGLTNALGTAAWSNSAAFYPGNANPSNYLLNATWLTGSNALFVLSQISGGASTNYINSVIQTATNQMIVALQGTNTALITLISSTSNTVVQIAASHTNGFNANQFDTNANATVLAIITNIVQSVAVTGSFVSSLNGNGTNVTFRPFGGTSIKAIDVFDQNGTEQFYIDTAAGGSIHLPAPVQGNLTGLFGSKSDNTFIRDTNFTTINGVMFGNGGGVSNTWATNIYGPAIQQIALVSSNMAYNIAGFANGHVTVSNISGFDKQSSVDTGPNQVANSTVIQGANMDIEDSMTGTAGSMSLNEGRATDLNWGTNGILNIGFTNDSKIFILGTNIYSVGITNIAQLFANQKQKGSQTLTNLSSTGANTNTYRAGSGVAITTNAPNDVVISFNGSVANTNTIFSSITVSNLNGAPFYTITAVTVVSTNFCEGGTYTYSPDLGFPTNGCGYIFMPLDPNNGFSNGVPISVPAISSVIISNTTAIGSSADGLYSYLLITNGPEYVFKGPRNYYFSAIDSIGGHIYSINTNYILANVSFPSSTLYTNVTPLVGGGGGVFYPTGTYTNLYGINTILPSAVCQVWFNGYVTNTLPIQNFVPFPINYFTNVTQPYDWVILMPTNSPASNRVYIVVDANPGGRLTGTPTNSAAACNECFLGNQPGNRSLGRFFQPPFLCPSGQSCLDNTFQNSPIGLWFWCVPYPCGGPPRTPL